MSARGFPDRNGSITTRPAVVSYSKHECPWNVSVAILFFSLARFSF
jgi:hypothetical protein